MQTTTQQRLDFNAKLMERARLHKDWAVWFDLLLERGKLEQLAAEERS